jgi:hypothetical protein
VTPSVVHVALASSAAERRELTVSNEGDEPFAVTTSVVPLPGAADASSAVQWITVQPRTFELRPTETRTVPVVVTVPDSVTSGGYYAVVTFTTEGQALTGADAAVAGEIGVPFLITASGSGAPVVEAEIERFSAVLEANGRVGFRAEILNTGTTHVIVRGSIELGEAGGTPVTSLDLPSSTLLLPSDRTVVEGPQSLLLENGQDYRAIAKLDVGGTEPLRRETTFTAETPAVELQDLRLCTRDDERLELRFGLINPGTLGVSPVVTLTARSTDDPTGGDPTRLRLPVAWPNATTVYGLDALCDLTDGAYAITVIVEGGPSIRFDRRISFQIGRDRAATSSCDE